MKNFLFALPALFFLGVFLTSIAQASASDENPFKKFEGIYKVKTAECIKNEKPSLENCGAFKFEILVTDDSVVVKEILGNDDAHSHELVQANFSEEHGDDYYTEKSGFSGDNAQANWTRNTKSSETRIISGPDGDYFELLTKTKGSESFQILREEAVLLLVHESDYSRWGTGSDVFNTEIRRFVLVPL